MVLGRVAYDYLGINKFDKANNLLTLLAAKNMSVFNIERYESSENQHGIPSLPFIFPPFHDKVREMEKPHLFSFVGGTRKSRWIQNECIRQYGESTSCMLLNWGGSGGGRKCLQPGS